MGVSEERDGPDGPTLDGAGPELLGRLLTKYEEVLRSTFPSVDQRLDDGVDKSAVANALDPLGLRAPDELLVWFGWHNGVRTGAPPSRLRQLDLDAATELYQWHASRPNSIWDSEWFPVVGDTRTAIAVDCVLSTDLPPRVRVIDNEYGASFDASNTKFQVGSLCTVVARWIRAFENGWYVPDDRGNVRVDQTSIPTAWLQSQIY